MSAPLFIFIQQIIFLSIKKCKAIRERRICNHTFFRIAYEEDSTCFLNDELYVIWMMSFFDEFSLFSDFIFATSEKLQTKKGF